MKVKESIREHNVLVTGGDMNGQIGKNIKPQI